MIDVMILFTGIINSGNPDDLNSGSVTNYNTSIEVASILYIAIFCVCIGVHLTILLAGTLKDIKKIVRRSYVRATL